MDEDRAFYERALRVVRETAAEVLSDGRAELVEQRHDVMPWFELRPASDRACAIAITPNGPGSGELSVGLGRAGSWTELWGSPDDALATLEDITRAALAGRYDEDVKGTKHVSRVLLDMGEFVFGGNVVRLKPRKGIAGWTHHSYEPY